MKPVLVLYATREGHTKSIAEHVVSILGAHQIPSELVDAAELPRAFSVQDYSAAILGASVEVGKHEAELVRFIKRLRSDLDQIPTAFLSISLSEAGADSGEAFDAFLSEAGWHGAHVKAVAGALLYSRHNVFIRLITKRMAQQTEEAIFTDWNSLDHMLDELIPELSEKTAAASG